MKILVITEEDELYIPSSIDHILTFCPHEIVSVVCAQNNLLKSKLDYFKKFVKTFGFMQILIYAKKLFYYKYFKSKFSKDIHISVKDVCRKHSVNYKISKDINSESFISGIKSLKVDIIACVSPTQIFGKRLISTPPKGCINIHTSLLPKHRGLYPTFWAMANGDQEIGISVHFIEEKIDTGKIIIQTKIDIPPCSSMHQMLVKTKMIGAEILLKSIGNISTGKFELIIPQGSGSYNSFPTKEAYIRFLSYGYTLW